MRLRVGGVALGGSGYPNATQTIALLKGSGHWDVRDRAIWLPPGTRLWRLVGRRWHRRVWAMICLVLSGCVQALSIVMTSREDERVYLPYPAPLTLWWLSFFPVNWRPFCIADAYISVWDTMFRDRGTGRMDSLLSRTIKRFERRSLQVASVVLVDTEANRRQLIEDFGLSEDRVRSLPLAIDKKPFVGIKNVGPESGCVRVLFVGTLVPLHGIEVTLSAIEQLAGEANIEFRLLGDGQQSTLVEQFIRDVKPSNFTWVRDWLSLDEIALEIGQADICLGVFGGAGKASRVLPFKLYYALAAGRAIITQSEYSLPEGLPPLPALPITGTSIAERAVRLASGIRSLAKDQGRRNSLAMEARSYFAGFLSGAVILDAWRKFPDK